MWPLLSVGNKHMAPYTAWKKDNIYDWRFIFAVSLFLSPFCSNKLPGHAIYIACVDYTNTQKPRNHCYISKPEIYLNASLINHKKGWMWHNLSFVLFTRGLFVNQTIFSNFCLYIQGVPTILAESIYGHITQ